MFNKRLAPLYMVTDDDGGGGGVVADVVAPVVDDSIAPVIEPQITESSWKWNDDFPGTGDDAPEWLNQAKYGDVAAQAKAYTELESRFGGFTGAPDAYEAKLPADLVLPEGMEFEFDDQDPIFKAIAPIAAELQMSQGGLDKLLGAYFQATAGEMEREELEMRQQAEKEVNSIPQGQQRINQLTAWAKANLSEEHFAAFSTNRVTTGAELELFETLINKSRDKPLPMPTNQQATAYTKEEIQAMYRETDENGKNRYLTDPSFRKTVERYSAYGQ